MGKLNLSLAIGDYDHVRDVLDGSVSVTGIELTVLRLPIEEMFYRATVFREFDVSEMSFAKVIGLHAAGDRGFVPLPVFPSRVFRHSSIYVHANSPLARLEDLAGKRIGVPEWAQTAAVYSRGMLTHDCGVDLRSIEWFQAGVNEAGRKEKLKLQLPPGLKLTVVPERSLSEMLIDGSLDAILSARPPRSFVARDGNIRRLLPDYREAEDAYARRTGIFPIMHVVAMRRDVYEANRWIAMNLYKAFDEAKKRSVKRARDITASFFPLPWVPDSIEKSSDWLGPDPWPYGIDANRVTLEAFASYAFEQGVCARKVELGELFPEEVQACFRI
ncbi:MAG: 4,5-dihydroxyphthalate decarboxylase [Betaproteobacteria bacterium]